MTIIQQKNGKSNSASYRFSDLVYRIKVLQLQIVR
jgi:hypothetical protein